MTLGKITERLLNPGETRAYVDQVNRWFPPGAADLPIRSAACDLRCYVPRISTAATRPALLPATRR